ncbi:pilus assembly protein CpaE [Sinirhodobacter populi]|uniref:Pilus assembly protein CpaE n=1 Tax=Paenirhodobacter populi TaxID=2306993 RepID=A0A443K9K8_9RHOB|nr:AAA family ATPase [Sinirhodobacter populi]RWR29382.1 pilus assembly protein CpaE [Sinirhodobacter populi]
MTAETGRILACTVSHDLMDFALLVEDMETELGENWGHLRVADALAYLRQPEAETLEFIALTLDATDEDEDRLADTTGIISVAKARGVHVLLIAEDVRPAILHRLLRAGADDFLPYPPPENALHDAIARLRAPRPEAPLAPPLLADLAAPGDTIPHAPQPRFGTAPQRDAAILAVQGLAGGVGATTLAVNLAWELANPATSRKDMLQQPPRVCLIDLDLQFGAVSTYLDLPRREAVFELLSDTANMDAESFGAALQICNERLHVLTSPPDLLPLDFITSEDVGRLIDMAQSRFDFVLIDMPKAVPGWSEAVLNRAHIHFAVLELELRSAQNTQTLLRALRAENLPVERFRFVLNRAPGLTELTGRSRVKRLAESLGISIDILLPDGGHPVTVSNDQALPLARTMPRAALRREIRKLAASLVDQERARVPLQQ